MFTPPPMESCSSGGTAFSAFNDFPPAAMSPPPMDDFSPDKEFSPPPMMDGGHGFSPSKEFSPPPLGDFSPNKDDPLSDRYFGFAGYSSNLDLEEDDSKFEQILQLKPREILEMKMESEQRTNFLQHKFLNGDQDTDPDSLSTAPPVVDSGSALVSNAEYSTSRDNEITETGGEIPQIPSVGSPVIDTHNTADSGVRTIEAVVSANDLLVNGDAHSEVDNSECEVIEPVATVATTTELTANNVQLPSSQNHNPPTSGLDNSVGNDSLIRETEKMGIHSNSSRSSTSPEVSEDEHDQYESKLNVNIASDSVIGDDVCVSLFENRETDSVVESSENQIIANTEISIDDYKKQTTPNSDKYSNEDDIEYTDKPQSREDSTSVTSETPNEATLAANNDEDLFASFCAPASDNVAESHEDWGNFEDNFAADNDTDAAEDWARHDEDHGDFADFDAAIETPSCSAGSRVEYLNNLLQKIEDDLENYISEAFLGAAIHDKELAEENEGLATILNDMVYKDEEVWRKVEDPASTPALDFGWSGSDLYSILLSTLNIDTRVMLNGESWRNSVQRNHHKQQYSNNTSTAGGILQPSIITPITKPLLSQPLPPSRPVTKEPTNPADVDVSTALPLEPTVNPTTATTPASQQASAVSLGSTRLQQCQQDEAEPGHSLTTAAEADKVLAEAEPPPPMLNQVDLHSPDFDWSLPNEITPTLPSIRPTTPTITPELTTGARSDNSAAGLSSVSANVPLTAPSSGAFSSLTLSTINSNKSALSSRSAPESLSSLDAFPLLNFMNSPVLMFPTRSPCPSRRGLHQP